MRLPNITTAQTDFEELSDRWPTLSPRQRLEAFRAIPRELADDFFLDLNSRDQLSLLSALPVGEHRIWLRLLAPDDTADLIQLAPIDGRPVLLGQLDETARRQVVALLAYKEDEAGGLMSPRFARLRPEMTVDEAISYLRRQAGQVETIYYAYALDDGQHLLGVVSFRDLFSASQGKTVHDVRRTEIITAHEDLDQEALANLLAHHLLAIPVVDSENRIQGIVTVDDIVQVVEEEASEDIQKVGGMEALDAPYLEVGFWHWWRIIRREFATGLVLGSVLATIGLTRIVVWQSIWHPYGEHANLAAMTVAFSLVGVVLFGTLAGSILPFILRSCRLDPASASAPFVATLVDVTGLVIYFSVASIVLRGTLL